AEERERQIGVRSNLVGELRHQRRQTRDWRLHQAIAVARQLDRDEGDARARERGPRAEYVRGPAGVRETEQADNPRFWRSHCRLPSQPRRHGVGSYHASCTSAVAIRSRTLRGRISVQTSLICARQSSRLRASPTTVHPAGGGSVAGQIEYCSSSLITTV